MKGAADSYNFQKYIVLLGISLLLIKFLAWVITDSVAILTDAMESIVNVAAGLIGLYALYLSSKPRDADHPYGHGRAEYLSALAEGLMILIAGALILYEAIMQISSPTPVRDLDIGLLLIAGAAIANYVVGTLAVRKGRTNRSQALVASGRHLRTDTYSSIGIIIGLVLMLALDKMGHDVPWADGAIALFFGAIIVMTGAKVLKSSMDGIMDKADMELLGEMVDCINENRHSDWIDVHNLRIEKHGGMLHVDMHVTFPQSMTVKEQYYEICEMKKCIQDKFGDFVELSVVGEPCRKFSCPACSRECPERKADFVEEVKWTIENLSNDMQHRR